MRVDVAQMTNPMPAMDASVEACPIILEERLGIRRDFEPVTVGIPFPKGMVVDPTMLMLLDQMGKRVPLQSKRVSDWSDGSVQWVLLDFLANVEPHGKSEYWLEGQNEGEEESLPNPMTCDQGNGILIINTGKAIFSLNTRVLVPFNQVTVNGMAFVDETRSEFVLTGEEGERYEPKISKVEIDSMGPIRGVVRVQGTFSDDSITFANFFAELVFYAQSSVVQMRMTLRNQRAARHPGGLWDLGDEGSVYFSGLSLQVSLKESGPTTSRWNTQPCTFSRHGEQLDVKIYQDSSGGENWQSSNHINRFGQVPHTFSGYRVTVGGEIMEEGKRATPLVTLEGSDKCISGAIEHFWQNFPKAIEIHNQRLSLWLFPERIGDVYELQGGEQKTHTCYLQFATLAEERQELDWIHDRLIPRSASTWYARSQAIKYITPREQEPNKEYLEFIDSAVEGERAFINRREIIDEYGWRNFGEVYADHEAIGHQGSSPLVSHYNNQYDVINGMLIEFLRSGDHRWHGIMFDLARHVIDIDIYHTKEDRPAYNGGMFWHTDHYMDAATATHRAYSKLNAESLGGKGYGGGPSNEQNYTSGLLHYYFLTGDYLAYEVVQGLADWVINMDQGYPGFLGMIDRRPRGLASFTANRDYHGPGRGGGNSINALIDGYRLTKDKKYLAKAEELIRRCIHPYDCIERRNLSNIEYRWSYLVFLQVLGKYLDCKVEWNDLDDMYQYAKTSLLHYAKWMIENEVPYKQVLDRVEIPTETWSAQDIRKSNVFYFAAKYSGEAERSLFLQKGEFFFSTSLSNLLSYKTSHLARPLILLLVNGYMHAYCANNPQESGPAGLQDGYFGQPCSFTPQLNEIYKVKEWAASFMASLMTRLRG